MIKIDIVSGFLGAGKTTLIKKMLEEVFKDEQVVLVENEYGEVGIDGGFLKDSGIEIRELNSGCICCSLVGDFNRSLGEVIEMYHPDRILIEPSGVGKLSDVITSVKKVEEEHDGVKLNALVTVVNAMKATKQMKAFGEFFNNQIENATTVVLSRTQNTEPEKLELCVQQIRQLNPGAAIITTPWNEITGDQILKVIEGQKSFMDELMAEFRAAHDHAHDHEHHHAHGHEHHHDHECHHDHGHEHHHDHDHCGCGHDHDHHADEVFTSWGRETPHKFTKAQIEMILKAFCDTEDYGIILRSKGMVPAEDGTWIYFDMVPGEYEIRQGEPDYTGRLCVIGTELDEDKLETLFGLK